MHIPTLTLNYSVVDLAMEVSLGAGQVFYMFWVALYRIHANLFLLVKHLQPERTRKMQCIPLQNKMHLLFITIANYSSSVQCLAAYMSW